MPILCYYLLDLLTEHPRNHHELQVECGFFYTQYTTYFTLIRNRIVKNILLFLLPLSYISRNMSLFNFRVP